MRRIKKRGRQSRRHIGIGIVLLFMICGFLTNCSSYNPSLYPSYDVLNPGEKVRENPVGFVYHDGEKWIVEWKENYLPDPERSYSMINEEMGIWIYELRMEIEKLRRMK